MSQNPPDLLEIFRTAGVLSPLDVHFARAMARLCGETDPTAVLGAAIASRAPSAGHVCADLRTVHATVRLEDAEPVVLPWPDPDVWRARMAASPLCAVGRSPLVLDGHLLYLERYARYQQGVVAQLMARVGRLRTDIDEAALRDGVVRLFPQEEGKPPNLQRVAALTAALRDFAVISGGPGTGKTTTVVALIVLLLEQALARSRRGEGRFPLRIHLVAPTGKAAARMTEAIRRGIGKKETDLEVLAAIPTEASTIHRKLGWLPDGRFRHDASNPLAADLVIVDEASMVDLALMARLVDAVPRSARLVLLGDRDQLASVEAGAVLGDICNAGEPLGGMSVAAAELLERLGGALPRDLVTNEPRPMIRDAVVHLTHTYRFGDGSGIGAVARAVNAGDGERALGVLRGQMLGPQDAPFSDVSLIELPVGAALPDSVQRLVVAGYAPCVGASHGKDALTALDTFRVLCAHRRGPLGVEGVNATVERWLQAAGLVRPVGEMWHGRPVIVTRNDYQVGLFNGDVGLYWQGPGGLAVLFPGSDGQVRAVAPGRLPPHETVFAMTVHKSQGSEFTHVLVVLPDRPSPVVTRELLYTAVTRASERVTVVGAPAVVLAAAEARVQRASGLRRALWQGSSDATP